MTAISDPQQMHLYFVVYVECTLNVYIGICAFISHYLACEIPIGQQIEAPLNTITYYL